MGVLVEVIVAIMTGDLISTYVAVHPADLCALQDCVSSLCKQRFCRLFRPSAMFPLSNDYFDITIHADLCPVVAPRVICSFNDFDRDEPDIYNIYDCDFAFPRLWAHRRLPLRCRYAMRRPLRCQVPSHCHVARMPAPSASYATSLPLPICPHLAKGRHSLSQACPSLCGHALRCA